MLLFVIFLVAYINVHFSLRGSWTTRFDNQYPWFSSCRNCNTRSPLSFGTLSSCRVCHLFLVGMLGKSFCLLWWRRWRLWLWSNWAWCWFPGSLCGLETTPLFWLQCCPHWYWPIICGRWPVGCASLSVPLRQVSLDWSLSGWRRESQGSSL